MSIKCPKPTLRSSEAFLFPTCLSRAAGIFTPNLWQLTGTTGVTGTRSAGRIPPLSLGLSLITLCWIWLGRWCRTCWRLATGRLRRRAAKTDAPFRPRFSLGWSPCWKDRWLCLGYPYNKWHVGGISRYQYAPLNNKGLISYRANLLRQQMLFIKHNTNITCTQRHWQPIQRRMAIRTCISNEI